MKSFSPLFTSRLRAQREQEDDVLKRDLDRQGGRISKLKEFVKSKSGKGGLDDSDDEGPARDEDEHNE